MKAYLHTFGCRANQYDTDAARAMLVAGGATIVERAADAEVAVFNSCAVTRDAVADLRQAVRRASRGVQVGARAGGRGAALRVIVMGCASALDDGTIAALPGVTDVLSGADLPGLAMALGVDPLLARERAAVQTGARALLRIQDGCDEHCTFCATTLARGTHRSRPVGDIVREAAALATGHPEIVLTGVHIGSYGSEWGSTLGALLARLVKEVPGVRFRLTSVEATEVDGQLAELLTGDALRVAPHLHAPLQSGSDAVLRRMGRHWYSARAYEAAADRVVSRCGTFALGADLIAGFPGETDADHEATMALVRAMPFTYLHVFPYSPRPGTGAVRLSSPVEPAIARRRAAELRALGEAKRDAYRTARAGGRADVIVVGEGGKREGLSEDYLPVALADPTIPRRSRFAAELALIDGRLTASRP